MNRGITSLSALSSFRVAAELESFSKAADQLSLTHGAVSRAVRLLEEDLGTPLFERRNRRVFLTNAGRELAKAVDNGFARIEAAALAIRDRLQNPQLTLSCEPTLLMRWLIPRISSFHADHPDIKLHLIAGGGPVLLGNSINLAIRRNDFIWPAHYHAEHLFDEHVGPVCRPGFVFPGASSFVRLQTSTRPDAWTNWERLVGHTFQEGGTREFEHFYFSLQAAVAGLGVAIGPWHLVRDDISAGVLAAPFGFVADGSSYQLLSATPFLEDSSASKVRDWLCSVATAPNATVPDAVAM
jgi:LysR family transcriptional regulator, glycine cleavage system transcriptional activator